MIAVWVIGFPVAGLYALIKKRDRLEQPEVKRYFIVLYQGYKPNRFYWEFVNVFRKVALLSINVFLSRFSPLYKGATATVVIIVILRIQIRLEPYTFPWNNEWELTSNVAAGLTIVGGLIFSSGDTVPVFDLLIFFIIVIANLKFLVLWVYLMAKATENQFPIIRKLSIILGIILNRKDNYNHNLEEPFSSNTKTVSFKASTRYSKVSKKKRKKSHRKFKKSYERGQL